MSGIDQRTREQRLSDEAARWRKSCQEARAALRDANEMLLVVYLRDRMHDPTDFTEKVSIEQLVDHEGRIMWSRVELLVGALLEAKPHLAVA